MREAVAKENWAELDLERTPWNDTGFVGVQKSKNKFRARLQVPGDGRGGTIKRDQYHVPGLFNTAEEAAVALAIMKRDMKARNGGKVVIPEKHYKPRKSSGKKPLQPTQSPLVTAAACTGTYANGYCHWHAHPVLDVACSARGCLTAADAASVRCDTALSAAKTIVYVSPQTIYICVRRQLCVVYELH